MKRRVPLSAAQEASFAMARALVVLERWKKVSPEALGFDRWMLVDFGVQFPHVAVELVPTLSLIMRGHGLAGADLSELFARRRFGTVRETFAGAVSSLLARDLCEEVDVNDGAPAFRLVAAGESMSSQLTSSYAFAVRAMADALCDAWKRRNPKEVMRTLGQKIPDQALSLASVLSPFSEWLVEAHRG